MGYNPKLSQVVVADDVCDVKTVSCGRVKENMSCEIIVEVAVTVANCFILLLLTHMSSHHKTAVAVT